MSQILRTDRIYRNSVPKSTVYFLDDGDGLRLQVCPNGAKYWILAYTLNGRESTYELGMFPDTGLGDARDDAASARRLVSDGIDPSMPVMKPAESR